VNAAARGRVQRAEVPWCEEVRPGAHLRRGGHPPRTDPDFVSAWYGWNSHPGRVGT
jgi:hypothetical protein